MNFIAIRLTETVYRVAENILKRKLFFFLIRLQFSVSFVFILPTFFPHFQCRSENRAMILYTLYIIYIYLCMLMWKRCYVKKARKKNRNKIWISEYINIKRQIFVILLITHSKILVSQSGNLQKKIFSKAYHQFLLLKKLILNI